MTPKPANASAVSEIYELLRYAATRKQPIAATYDGQPRLLCPHVGGRKSSRLPVFCGSAPYKASAYPFEIQLYGGRPRHTAEADRTSISRPLPSAFVALPAMPPL